ncbi:MAG: GNAT family N-acetyltransferase [Limisphaerales bacterium]
MNLPPGKSYAFNGGDNVTRRLGKETLTVPGLTGVKLSSVRHPGRTILLAEGSALSPYSWHDPSSHDAPSDGSNGTAYNASKNVVGDTEHVRICAGHIGFEVLKEFRGHSYALEACRAVAPFVRSIYRVVTITANPDNHASIRTIERLGATFSDEVPVPPHDPGFQRGARRKKRYKWTP